MARTELIRVTREPEQTWLQKALGLVRSYTTGPLTARSPEIAKYLGGGGPTLSGVSVTEETAMQYSAVWSAVTMISDDIASLPLMLYKRLKDGGKDRFEDHPLYRLLHDAPNPEMDSMVWRRTMQTHALLWQNAYSEIERDSVGRPVAVWPLVPERVTVFRDRGQIVYRVANVGSGGGVNIPAEDMIHLVGQSHDGSVGGSLVTKARESLGLGLAAEKFGAAFFGNGAAVGGVISYKGPRPQELSEKNYREQLEMRHAGVERAHKLLALYNDATYSRMVIPPNEGQFNETRIFQIREVARWFKIPPHKLGDLADATYSNVEQMDAAYLSSCIRPWLVLWQQQLSRKLIARSEQRQQYIEHLTQGFLSVDAAGRAALYPAEFNVGSLTPNEIRGYENRDPITGGDQAFVQMNMMPLSRINDWVDAQIDSVKAKAQPKAVPAPPTEAQVEEIKSLVARAIADQNAAIISEADKRAKAEADVATIRTTLEMQHPVFAPPTDEQQQAFEDSVKRAIAAYDETVRAEAERRVAAETESAAARAQVADLQRDCDAARADIETKEAAHAESLREYKELMRQEVSAIDERYKDAAEKLHKTSTERDDAQRAKDDTDVMLGVAERERDAAVARESAVKAEIAVAQQAREEAETRAAALVVERDGLTVRVTTSETVAAELRAQLTEQREAAERLAASHAETAAARAVAESRMAEKDAHAATIETRHVEAIDAQAVLTGRLETVTAAHRALLVDAIERLLQKESDRARKAQATPEKLRAWVESFYQTHGETCRSVLRPVMIAWASCAGVNAEAALSGLVQAHLEQSRRDLRLAADVDDPDELAANVARVLHRWDTERADAVADALMAEGDRYGH